MDGMFKIKGMFKMPKIKQRQGRDEVTEGTEDHAYSLLHKNYSSGFCGAFGKCLLKGRCVTKDCFDFIKSVFL